MSACERHDGMPFAKGVGRCLRVSVCDVCVFAFTAGLLGTPCSRKSFFVSLLWAAAPGKYTMSYTASWAHALAVPHGRTPSHPSQHH